MKAYWHLSVAIPLRPKVCFHGASPSASTHRICTVYETSAYLAIIAANGRHHALPILTYLIFEFDRIKPPNTYLDAASRPLKKTANSDAVLAYLLEILSSNHPSQSEFLSAFQEARSNQRISAAAEVFLQHLATALRRIDTVLLRRLLRPRLSAVDPPFDTGSHPANPNSLIGDVFKVLLDRIRLQARNSVWLCIRTAYRELSVNASGEWLVQSLLLEDAAPDAVASANRWLQARAESGEAQETSLDGERIPGRWSFRRPSN